MVLCVMVETKYPGNFFNYSRKNFVEKLKFLAIYTESIIKDIYAARIFIKSSGREFLLYAVFHGMTKKPPF